MWRRVLFVNIRAFLNMKQKNTVEIELPNPPQGDFLKIKILQSPPAGDLGGEV